MLPTSIGAKVTVFVTFKKCWPRIDTSKYVIKLDDLMIAKTVRDQKNNILIEEQFQIILFRF